MLWKRKRKNSGETLTELTALNEVFGDDLTKLQYLEKRIFMMGNKKTPNRNIFGSFRK